MTDQTTPLISVKVLEIDYGPGALAKMLGAKTVHAVKGVSFDITAGHTFGIVGESGSGKSTIARAIIGLEPFEAGSIHYDGTDINRLSTKQKRRISRDIQMVFQDPSSALNPKLKVGSLLAERIKIHRPGEYGNRAALMRQSLDEVGLPHEHLERFPHQLSGGQQQRVVIALGLVSQPRLLICDEAVSGLDVSSQAQVLNLLNELKTNRELSILFITHDMGVARYISDEVAVMRHGELVEQGPAEKIFDAPELEYTQTLMDAVPKLPKMYSFTDV